MRNSKPLLCDNGSCGLILGLMDNHWSFNGQPLKFYLSYDVIVIQWIKSCLKNRMTTRVITLWRVDVT